MAVDVRHDREDEYWIKRRRVLVKDDEDNQDQTTRLYISSIGL